MMINQCFLTQFLELPTKLCTLVNVPLARALNLLSTMSKNAYVIPSLLQSNNGTNFNHLEKRSIITKTYRLC
jgi:hypothetical protein